MIGCPGGSCSNETTAGCKFRLVCMARTDAYVLDAQAEDLIRRVRDRLGHCERCGLDVVRYKGSNEAVHVIPAAPLESRTERINQAHTHRPLVPRPAIMGIVNTKRRRLVSVRL